MSLLAALATALSVAPGADDRCLTCDAPTALHIVNGRWVGHAEQLEPKPQQFVRLPRLLQFPAQRREVHARSVARSGAALAMSESEQG